MSTLSCSINQCVYHDGLLQIAITYDYALIDWGIVYNYHTHYTFMSSFLSSSSSSSSLSCLLFFFPPSFCFFSAIFFSFAFCWSFTYIFFINTYYTYFFKCTLNSSLDKCTWYLTEQHWGIVRTIQTMRYYTYWNVNSGT